MGSSALLVIASLLAAATTQPAIVDAKLADRARVVRARGGRRDYGDLAIEGGAYRGRAGNPDDERTTQTRSSTGTEKRMLRNILPPDATEEAWELDEQQQQQRKLRGDSDAAPKDETPPQQQQQYEPPEHFSRRLSSQLTGCCYTYEAYGAADMCSLYGQDCQSGETPSHDSGDDSCTVEGLAFIGISFSVNTASGNPYSYQLCDQFPMENIIDRNYDYVMSMDEDGWLVGGGYKSFDYSGKMPYIDSSHTELLRVGSLDADNGGTTIDQVYEAMSDLSFAPFSVFPEYLKGGGGHHSGDDDEGGSVPSADITFIMSIVDTYEDDDSYSAYDSFLDLLFTAMYAVNAGACMDDRDTDPHVSMSRGVKFMSSAHQETYVYNANLEVAVWQSMYPQGVPIGSSGYASFPAGSRGNKQYVGYGNLYFFFDRANITKAFRPNRDLSNDESYYATLYASSDTSGYYSSVTEVGFDYGGSGSGDDDQEEWEHNPYSWKATMAMHDMTDGWDLPPNCYQEGETFFGIPLSRKSDSNMQSSSTFQEQFDFESIIDRNYTYVTSFGTNHGWLVGEEFGNSAGSIVDKDTAHIPLFYTGTTNPDMGGISLSDLIKVGKSIDFGTLYIKPAFVFIDDNGHIKLQFEMDPNSALSYLYDNLCKELGIAWNYDTPYNSQGVYTNCAMHASGDRAKYGCGPEGSNSGGFCPQMTVAYSPRFESEEQAAAYLDSCNNYVDYWRSLYPSGAAVGTNSFCPSGGCLGLFLNRYDLFNVFKPDLGGSWVEYGDFTVAPTLSPAPTWTGGCDEPHNFHLDRCFRKRTRPKASAVVWDSLGAVGQFTLFLLVFMSMTLAISIFLARARKRRRKGEGYIAFLLRDARRKGKKKRRRKIKGNRDLEEAMIDSKSRSSRKSRSRSKSKGRSGGDDDRTKSSRKSRSKSRTRSKSRSRREADDGVDGKSVRTSKSSKSKRSKSSRSRSRSKSRNRNKREDEDGDGEDAPRDSSKSGSNRQQLV